MTGVLVTVAGTIIVAPGGAKLKLDQLRERSKRSAAAVEALWRRISGRPGPLQTVEASGTASWRVSGGGVGTVIGGFRPGPGASTEERLQLNRDYIEDVERRLNQLAKHVHAEFEERTAAIQQLGQALSGEVQATRGQITHLEQQAARIDANGLPVIALGIVLSGIPDILAEVPAYPWSWVWPALGMAWTSRVAWKAWREAHPKQP